MGIQLLSVEMKRVMVPVLSDTIVPLGVQAEISLYVLQAPTEQRHMQTLHVVVCAQQVIMEVLVKQIHLVEGNVRRASIVQKARHQQQLIDVLKALMVL